MKRFLSIVIASSLLFAFSACKVTPKPENFQETIQPENPLSNTYYRLTQDKALNIAYLGGSITQGGSSSHPSKSWVSLTTEWFREKFPEAEIYEHNVGLSNTGSNYGIFRLDHDILDKVIPDLIFIEFTSNDWGRFGDENISKQNESIIRRLYEANPAIDIVFLFTSFGHDSPCRRASTALAEHYGLPVIDPGSQLKTLIDTQENGVYDKYSPDKIHPNDTGHAFYLDCIEECFSEYLIDTPPTDVGYYIHELPEPLNKRGLFMNPEIISPFDFKIPENFKSVDVNCTMKYRTYEKAVGTKTEGAEYEFSFEGTGFGLLVYKTREVSSIEYSVDGGEYIPYAIGDMHNYNHGQMYIMEYDLEPGTHTVKIKNVASQYGTELNIMGICVNR